jgi:glutamate synthase domain-containing protein 2/glutamate synthase domain-containing protein 1/glutamate synthase domain-containing protein 3
MPVHDHVSGERDACGIGFLADSSGRPSRAVVSGGLDALCRVKHRGAVAADELTGDGAGLLLPIPATIAPPGWAVAMAFLDPADPAAGRAALAEACAAEGLRVARWRDVPTDEAALGERAREAAPLIQQALVEPCSEGGDGERRAYRARRRAERIAADERLRLALASFSYRTVTYKALCAADQLAHFYADLADEGCTAWFALFHQRYSTNTAPAWERAQPFRMLAHNGEINTIRGNLAAMAARAATGPDDGLAPAVDVASSDSGILDGALELLVREGRSLMHAAAMLVPPAWESDERMDGDVRAFFRFHSALMEPWDGPAALVFSDGQAVGAALDRNGLRPLRVALCEDGLVACASEAGAVDTSGRGTVTRRRLGPGESLLVSPEQGVAFDAEVKRSVATSRGGTTGVIRRTGRGTPSVAAPERILPLQVAAGYTKEEITVVLRPMATQGQEPVSSMGDDTAQPPLASFRRPVFSYLKQRFAQVTNPPLDHLRESHVMSLRTLLGPRPALSARSLDEPLREYEGPVLYPDAVAELIDAGAAALDATWPAGEGAGGLERACRRLASEAVAAVRAGARAVVVTDRAAGPELAGVPSALAAGAVHHALVAAGLRPRAGLVADAADVRESHHLACLVTNGADAVCPRLALETIAALAGGRRLGSEATAAEAGELFVAALEGGLLKIMSKMGISTVSSYRGAQVIEAVGLGRDVVELSFPGVSSPLGGVSFADLGADALERHAAAWAGAPALAAPGSIKHRAGGEYHALNPAVIGALQAAVSTEMEAAHALRRALARPEQSPHEEDAYAEFAELVNGRPPAEPRDLLDLVTAPVPLPLDEVEDASSIARRFSAGAMSLGALSPEAHDTVARALDLVGGMANTGEGGEDPAGYGGGRGVAIKQVASARFGVTPAYLAHAREIQIKMAQGSKPGEGGQLPGVKVSAEIARLRHTVPGVPLISPPPHHDIYSIEDLAQLIFDLEQANPDADVSVKLVSSEGVGTVAAGVVKGGAGVVHVSGGDGGTGASPLSSIKNAGLPWEIGLADAHATLAQNGLRGRARLRVDGGFKTGRDVVVAALLGADEFSFGTALLVAEGCILVRTCHRDTCPVGIATQNPALRAKFAGTPEMVARYLLLVAEEARGLLAQLGLPSIAAAVGRTDLLRRKETGDPRADALDPAPLLERNGGGFTGDAGLARPRSPLGDRLHDDALGPVLAGAMTHLEYPITTSDRAVGARLGAALAAAAPAHRGMVTARFQGHAGQSFGAFLSDGVELILEGDANDYVCKGMGGGRVVVRPPAGDAGDPVLAGNTLLYGATGGTLFVAGRVGERFAVRNSGAVAVVEGTGDHACEYMTAGAVVILGPTGRNLGAGMSGGEAYVFDPDDALEGNLNPHLVAAYAPARAQLDSLRRVIERHARATGSARAAALLKHWDLVAARFKRVAPVAEVARLEALFAGSAPAA